MVVKMFDRNEDMIHLYEFDINLSSLERYNFVLWVDLVLLWSYLSLRALLYSETLGETV